MTATNTRPEDAEKQRQSSPSLATTLWSHAVKISNDKLKSAVIIVGYTLIKVLTVSRGDLTTALGVLRTAGAPNVLLGGLLSGAGLLTAVCFAGLSAWVVWQIASIRAPRDGSTDGAGQVEGHMKIATSVGLLVVVALACTIVTPWPIFLMSLAGAIFIPLLLHAHAALATKPPPPTPRQVSLWVGEILLGSGAAFAAIIAAYTITYAMWLPHEAVVTQNHPHGRMTTAVGYVLDDSDGWTTLLQSQSRIIIRLKSTTITQRKVCHLAQTPGSPLGRPTLWGIIEPTRVHKCPPASPRP
jgi:hypothetical protein